MKHGVTHLKLYSSVLARKETENSDIDFLAIFDPDIPYDWEANFNLQESLEAYFGRRVSVVDARRIPNVFRPSIDIDPIDIMELSSDQNYSISPKTSKLYYIMLDRMFREFYPNHSGYSESLFCLIAEHLSWWFSRLLRLIDNDLREYQGFNFIEFLYLCDKLTGISIWDYSGDDLRRFKELLIQVKNYVLFRIRTLKQSSQSPLAI